MLDNKGNLLGNPYHYRDSRNEGMIEAVCKAERTNHIRTDKLKNDKGEGVPVDVPYAMMITGDTEIIVQYSRMDTS